jgi:hypothetical protein
MSTFHLSTKNKKRAKQRVLNKLEADGIVKDIYQTLWHKGDVFGKS